MSRLRRLVLCDRFFFVTCRLFHGRSHLGEAEFGLLVASIQSRRAAQCFMLTVWVFLPDHWHAILYPRYPATISGGMESIKVSSTRLIHGARGDAGRLWQGRFFDRALRTVKEYHEKVAYIHWNPVRAGLVSKAEERKNGNGPACEIIPEAWACPRQGATFCLSIASCCPQRKGHASER